MRSVKKNTVPCELLFPLVALSLVLCGCDFEDDDDDAAGSGMPAIAFSSPSVLVSPQKLKEWIDNGYVDDWGFDVVVFDTGFDWDFDNRPVYDAGHVPGAYYVEVLEFYQDRSDGVVGVVGMVPDGPHMDAFVQKHGIDRYTTVVFTGNSIMATARAYWAFRYWGFARSQLFLLDGSANGEHSVWTSAGYELETEEPPLPEPSDFSVGDWPGNMDEVRVPLEDFLRVAAGKVEDAVVLDARSAGEWVGYISPETNLFGFRLNDSVWRNWGDFLVGGQEGTHQVKPAAQLEVELGMLGITRDKTVYAFCMSGGRAAVIFAIFEGVLDRDVKMYDGSSTELGQLGCLEDDEGNELGLSEDSPWRFDLRTYCEVIAPNDPANVLPPVIVDAYAASARAVNDEDKAY